jgi:hypothetical protein
MANPRPSNSFKKGDPRINRKGRPKIGRSISDKFRDALEEGLTGDYTRLDSIIDAVVTKALKGDQAAIEYCLARGFGKMTERVESVNLNKNYDFSNLPLEERMRLLEAIRNARPTIPSDETDTD